MLLAGKSAVVTGSTSGIGLGIARALAEAGADIVLNGFGEAAAIEKLRSGLATEFGVRVTFSKADIAYADEVADMIDTAEVRIWPCRYPGEQCRHSTHGFNRGISHRSMEPDHRD